MTDSGEEEETPSKKMNKVSIKTEYPDIELNYEDYCKEISTDWTVKSPANRWMLYNFMFPIRK